MSRFKIICTLMLACFMGTGCGMQFSIPTAKLAGKITFDGEPITWGTIDFVPLKGKTPTAAAEIKQGAYSAIVPHGKMKIVISAPRVVGQSKAFDVPNAPMNDVTEEMIPAVYNAESTLEENVTEDREHLDFELESPSVVKGKGSARRK